MKSSRFRQVLPPQMPPRWIGSPGVTFCVVQVLPPSNVVEIYRYQTPANGSRGNRPVSPEQSSLSPQAQLLPPVSVPKKATAARPGLPAVAATNVAFRIGLPLITVAPTSMLGSQVTPLSCDTATFGWVSPALSAGSITSVRRSSAW